MSFEIHSDWNMRKMKLHCVDLPDWVPLRHRLSGRSLGSELYDATQSLNWPRPAHCYKHVHSVRIWEPPTLKLYPGTMTKIKCSDETTLLVSTNHKYSRTWL
jgi:hypothetical protein